MPKAKQQAKSAPSAVNIPGQQPGQKRAGKRTPAASQPSSLKPKLAPTPKPAPAPAPVPAPKLASKTKPTPKAKPARAVVIKATKTRRTQVSSEDDDEQYERAVGEQQYAPADGVQQYEPVVDEQQYEQPEYDEDSYPDDGMGEYRYQDDIDAQTAGGVLDFVDDLNNQDEDLDAAEEDEMQWDEDASRGFRSLHAAPGTVLSSTHPVPLRTPSKPSALKPDIVVSSGPFTPYIPRVNPKDPSKPLLTLQSPLTRNILKRVQHKIRACAVVQHAFPDPDDLIDAIAEFVVAVANQIGAPGRALRYQDDPVYEEIINRLSKRAITGLRSELIQFARDIAGPGHQLGPGRGSPAQNKAYIEMLSARGNYVYRELETVEDANGAFRVTKRAGPYRHASIATIILQEFFTSHEQMAVAEETKHLFNPIPLPTIAFAATVMQCALRDWATGVRVKSSSDFSADEWTATYKAHLRELERMRDAKPREVDMWTRKLWKDCWTSTSQYLAANGPEDESFITPGELDDFEDVEAEV